MSQSFVNGEMHVLQQRLRRQQQLLLRAEALSSSMSTAATAGSVALPSIPAFDRQGLSMHVVVTLDQSDLVEVTMSTLILLTLLLLISLIPQLLVQLM